MYVTKRKELYKEKEVIKVYNQTKFIPSKIKIKGNTPTNKAKGNTTTKGNTPNKGIDKSVKTTNYNTLNKYLDDQIKIKIKPTKTVENQTKA